MQEMEKEIEVEGRGEREEFRTLGRYISRSFIAPGDARAACIEE
jgi:hypothetical protein